ncbi:MAG: hypothetical protein HY823_04220 [Acidobacteria bacterium]|nr:hypothetical protein [Acidobacteriota bacterium]
MGVPANQASAEPFRQRDDGPGIGVHTTLLQGMPLRTGDLIFTCEGDRRSFGGEFWLMVGRMFPGEVDHLALYLGPGGRCIEAGARGAVICFDFPGGRWDGPRMASQRGFADRLFGIADPIEGRGIPPERELEVRRQVAAYCLRQLGKPYNLNFFDPETENAFYCSQLAYKAYRPWGVDLNRNGGIPGLANSRRVVLPQAVWEACPIRARM